MCLPCTRISIAVLNFQGTDYFAISLFDRSKCGSKTTGTGRRVVFTNRVSTPKRRRHSKRLKKEQEINKELRLEINFFRDFCVLFNLQWATKVLRHFVIFEYLRQISFLISTILPPPPFSMLNFLSLEFASFLYNIEKGGGGWLST